MAMTYTLDQFSADCRAALQKDPGPAGRELVRQYTERASSDPDFISKYLGPDADAERRILYEDPDLHFCILAHVYKGAKTSAPHDHGSSWAVYSQVAGVTEMTDWKLLEKPAHGNPGKVIKGAHLRSDAWQCSRLQRGRGTFSETRNRNPADPN
jgi:hypothetical protein